MLERDARRLARIGAAVVFGGIGLFLAWAVLAPLDEGIVAPAVVQTEAKRKPIQHPVTAVIQHVYVKEGQFVTAGMPLVQLDDSQVAGVYQSARAQYLALKARESRLAAESAGLAQVRFDPMLLSEENRAVAAEYVAREKSLFSSRGAALAADLSVLEQSVQAAREQEKALGAQLAGRKRQQEIINEQIASSRNLAQAGFLSRTKLLEEERVAADIASQVDELGANLLRGRAQIAELTLRIAQRKRDFAKEVEESATDARKELGGLEERLGAAKVEVNRTRILSPADGMVVGLAIQSAGAVVPEGAKIMDIVPAKETLLLEAMIAPDVVERVHPGLKADVRLTGFSDLPYLAIDGKVLSVSADRIEAQGQVPAHFLARVEITPEGLKKLGTRHIQPGMTAEVIIKTGERTVLTYVLKPMVRRLAGAMTEP